MWAQTHLVPFRYWRRTLGLQVRYADCGGYRFCYAYRGKPGMRPSILMLHGFSAHKDTWLTVVKVRICTYRINIHQKIRLIKWDGMLAQKFSSLHDPAKSSSDEYMETLEIWIGQIFFKLNFICWKESNSNHISRNFSAINSAILKFHSVWDIPVLTTLSFHANVFKMMGDAR